MPGAIAALEFSQGIRSFDESSDLAHFGQVVV
jgi:hypothetical protein